MEDFRTKLRSVFGVPEEPTELVPQEIVVEEKEVPKNKRTIGNIMAAAEAQRIYNPDMPKAPAAPPQKTIDQGTSKNMEMQGWGK